MKQGLSPAATGKAESPVPCHQGVTAQQLSRTQGWLLCGTRPPVSRAMLLLFLPSAVLFRQVKSSVSAKP